VQPGAARIATVVTSTSLAPYRRVERLAWAASGLLGVGLLLVVHLVLRANVARALRPVQQMTAQAGRWSADDVGRRFGAEARPVELAELAHTLDGVLDRLAAVLRRERQLSDELSHELRTPLTRIQAEVDLLRDRPRTAAERDDAYAALDDAVRSMSEIIETLMASARTSAGATSGRAVVLDVLEPLVAQAAAARPSLHAVVDLDADLVAGVDRALLERLASPVVENAVRHARSMVEVTGAAGPEGVRLAVTDDGPGVAAERREMVFEPGWRGDNADGHDGAGLGLALARRLAHAGGGRVSVEQGERGGARFVIDLPAA
jgi:signal transduction histidine kinase